jgi:NADPH-dependent glutamate synthase beta subunit-like oxidoreductase
LPKKVLDWEVQGILDLGVDVRLNTNFGVDATLDSLREEGFDAFFLGIGAWEHSNLRCENEDAPGVLGGIEFLTAHALGTAEDVGKKVIVVGGGNTAVDCARTCKRLGADVTMMYRRTRAEMPANIEEIEATEEEGIDFLFLAMQTKVILDENGRAKGIEYLKMELGEPDASGRRKPVPIEGSETIIEADTIIAAIGQKPDLDCLYEGGDTCPLETTKWKTIVGDPVTHQTAMADVFAGGDAFGGPDLVITAVGDGRRAARSIHYYLTEGEVPVPDKVQRQMLGYTMFEDVTGIDLKKRHSMPHICKLEDRTCTFNEVEGALTEAEARAEASRCLRCGLICYDKDQAAPEVPLEQIYHRT